MESKLDGEQSKPTIQEALFKGGLNMDEINDIFDQVLPYHQGAQEITSNTHFEFSEIQRRVLEAIKDSYPQYESFFTLAITNHANNHVIAHALQAGIFANGFSNVKFSPDGPNYQNGNLISEDKPLLGQVQPIDNEKIVKIKNEYINLQPESLINKAKELFTGTPIVGIINSLSTDDLDCFTDDISKYARHLVGDDGLRVQIIIDLIRYPEEN